MYCVRNLKIFGLKIFVFQRTIIWTLSPTDAPFSVLPKTDRRSGPVVVFRAFSTPHSNRGNTWTIRLQEDARNEHLLAEKQSF